MSTRTPNGFVRIAGLLALPLALFLILPVLSHDAGAQQQLAPGAQAPTTQTPPPLAGAPPLVPPANPTALGAPPPAPNAASAAPSMPLPADWGLCQCISDKTSLDFTCPGSADACQSSCGPHFSFKPDARCRQAAAATPAPTH